MKTVYLDLIGGAAGDMLMAALIDAGASVDRIRQALDAVGLEDVELRLAEAHPCGLRGLQVDMMVRGELADADPHVWAPLTQLADLPQSTHHHRHRPYAEIRALLDAAALEPKVLARAQRTFRLLAEAEAHVHGADVDSVEFHEVGSDDAIADIVGVAVALEDLGVGRVLASPAPVGRGRVVGAHGPIPLPGPATLHLLRDVPLEGTELEGEPVTPTGAALLRAHVDAFGPMPSMTLRAVGVGAGHRTWPDRPNIVRALLGEATLASSGEGEALVELEANVDDMSPQDVPELLARLLVLGALDAWATPVLMKKGRPGHVVFALVRPSQVFAAEEAFFRYSSTLGVRRRPVRRTALAREMRSVETPFGTIRLKVVERPGGASATPEFEDCQSAARLHDVAIEAVRRAALRAFHHP